MITLAERIRETAWRVPRAQARRLFDIAADVDRLEAAIDEIVGNACDEEKTLAEIEARGHG